MNKGTVKFFNDSKGFGFIKEDDSSKEHFVHISGLIDEIQEGDNVEFEVELITPIAMDKELRFAIREGGHTVGAGVVTEIVE